MNYKIPKKVPPIYLKRISGDPKKNAKNGTVYKCYTKAEFLLLKQNEAIESSQQNGNSNVNDKTTVQRTSYTPAKLQTTKRNYVKPLLQQNHMNFIVSTPRCTGMPQTTSTPRCNNATFTTSTPHYNAPSCKPSTPHYIAPSYKPSTPHYKAINYTPSHPRYNAPTFTPSTPGYNRPIYTPTTPGYNSLTYTPASGPIYTPSTPHYNVPTYTPSTSGHNASNYVPSTPRYNGTTNATTTPCFNTTTPRQNVNYPVSTQSSNRLYVPQTPQTSHQNQNDYPLPTQHTGVTSSTILANFTTTRSVGRPRTININNKIPNLAGYNVNIPRTSTISDVRPAFANPLNYPKSTPLQTAYQRNQQNTNSIFGAQNQQILNIGTPKITKRANARNTSTSKRGSRSSRAPNTPASKKSNRTPKPKKSDDYYFQ